MFSLNSPKNNLNLFNVQPDLNEVSQLVLERLNLLVEPPSEGDDDFRQLQTEMLEPGEWTSNENSFNLREIFFTPKSAFKQEKLFHTGEICLWSIRSVTNQIYFKEKNSLFHVYNPEKKVNVVEMISHKRTLWTRNCNFNWFNLFL